MKPPLVDDFIKTAGENSTQVLVTVDGQKLTGYQIAKPVNYDSQYFTLWERLSMAFQILKAKAIAVRYFCDMSEKEQEDYVRDKIKTQ